jgi:transketolase
VPTPVTCSNLSGAVLNVLAASLPEIIGGSADLTPSNKTQFKGAVDFQKHSPLGRYIRFGVRCVGRHQSTRGARLRRVMWSMCVFVAT